MYFTSSSAQSLAGGAFHSIVLCQDSTLWASGKNNLGQLGDGTNTDKNIPVQVSGISTAISIAVGQDHSIVLLADSTVWCWGLNFNGQLGDGTTLNRNIPTKVPGLSQIVTIAAGNIHSLALKSNGTVVAWGANFFGQIGDATNTERHSPVQVLFLTNVTSIAAGGTHSLALKNDHSVWGWGANGLGQLGDGTGIDKKTPVSVSIPDVKEISAGRNHSMALKNNGDVYCWGSNLLGAIGDGSFVDRFIPQKSSISNVIDIEAGKYHSMGIKSDSTLWGWGGNYNGQLGDSTTIDRRTPVQTKSISAARTVGTGHDHSFAVANGGQLYSFGFNINGALGDGGNTNQNLPVTYQIACTTQIPCKIPGSYFSITDVLLDADFTDKSTSATSWNWDFGDSNTDNVQHPAHTYGAAGTYYVCLTAQNICGSDTYCDSVKVTCTPIPAFSYTHSQTTADFTDLSIGALSWHWDFGDGDTSNQQNPTHQYAELDQYLVCLRANNACGSDSICTPANIFEQPKPIHRVIAAGFSNTFLLCEDSTVFATGKNQFGALGDGTTIDKYSPIASSISDVISLNAAPFSTHAAKADGTAWAWGLGTSGQLGDSTTSSIFLPNQVSPFEGSTYAVAASTGHALALTQDGRVFAWGNGIKGQLGDGNFNVSYIPVLAKGLSSMVDVDVGYQHSLGLKADGTVWVWGNSDWGQTSWSSPLNTKDPTIIPSLSNIIDICASKFSSYALREDGKLFAWGHNQFGKLGDSTTVSGIAIREVKHLSNVVAIESTDDHCLALKSDSTVWAWGYNYNGQLGDGTDSTRLTPVQVLNLTGIVAIAAGSIHSLALEADGTVWGWGLNGAGGLGDSLISWETYVPVIVDFPCNGMMPCDDPGVGFTHTHTDSTYTFSDITSTASSWFWDFGNGDTSTLQNPIYTFLSPGIYNVCLSATNGCGRTEISCEEIPVGCVIPQADFVTHHPGNNTIDFIDNSNNAVSWLWDFGDGTTDTAQNPSHTFPSTGVFTICLKVESACQDIDSICSTLNTGVFGISGGYGFSVFPNPSSGRSLTLALSLDNQLSVQWRLSNTLGEELIKEERQLAAGQHKIKLEAPNIKPGIYFLDVLMGNGDKMGGKVVLID